MHRKYTYSKIGTRNYFDNYFIHVCNLVLISLIILRLRDVGVQSWGHGLGLETGVGVDLLEPLRDARVREAQVLQRGEGVRGQRGGGEQRQWRGGRGQGAGEVVGGVRGGLVMASEAGVWVVT